VGIGTSVGRVTISAGASSSDAGGVVAVSGGHAGRGHVLVSGGAGQLTGGNLRITSGSTKTSGPTGVVTAQSADVSQSGVSGSVTVGSGASSGGASGAVALAARGLAVRSRCRVVLALLPRAGLSPSRRLRALLRTVARCL
jgi:hypothetical protein